MTDQQTLAAIIDGCIEDVLLGIATVEECLEREPEHRAELEPLLRAAVAFSRIPVPEVQPSPVRRAAFMAELRSTPQERPRFRMPGLPALGFGNSLLRFASVAAPAAVIAIVALALVWGGSPSTASAATLTVFAGSVEQQVDGSWQPVADGSTLKEGATIRTLDAALAMLTFPDGSTATVDASTQLALEHISVNGDRMISLRQITGRIWNDVVPIEQGDSYVIRTPHAVVAAHGTVFETVVNGDTAVLTAEGRVSLAQKEASVEVFAGQLVRATTQSISAPETAPNLGEIRVSGPVSAYLSSPRGAATGVLMNGLVFRQIPGITTTTEELDGENLQRIALGDPEQGEYSLVLRRFAPGDGRVTVETPTGTIEVAIPENVAIARLPLAVSATGGGALALNTLSAELESVGQLPPVRVVETERSRQAETAEATPRATQAPAAVATEAGNAPSGGGEGQQRAQNTVTATPGQATRTAAAAPQATPDSWAGRLQDALARGNDRRLADILDQTLDTDDDATKATRLALLAAVMSDPAAAARIRAQADRRVVEEITAEAAQLTPGLADGLRSGFAPPAPPPAPSNDRVPAPNSRDDRPGNSGSTPGNSDTAPGNSGNKTPGGSGNAPGSSGNGVGSSGNNDRGDDGGRDGNDRGTAEEPGDEAPRRPVATPDDPRNDRTPNWLQQLLDTLRRSLSGGSDDRSSAAATPTPTPTPTPTATPRVAATSTPPPTPTPTPRATATAAPTPRATETPTATPAATATPTATPTQQPTATPTATPTGTPTPAATASPNTTATPAPTASPTVTPSPTQPPPTATPTPEAPWWWPPWWGPYPW